MNLLSGLTKAGEPAQRLNGNAAFSGENNGGASIAGLVFYLFSFIPIRKISKGKVNSTPLLASWVRTARTERRERDGDGYCSVRRIPFSH